MPGYSDMALVPSGQFPVPTAVVDGKLSKEQRSYWEEQLRQYNKADVQKFFWEVEQYKLNPFGVAQIYPLPIDGHLVSHVGINGLVLLAQRTGLYAGMTEPMWCGQPKDMDTLPVWRDFWNYTDLKGKPLPPAAAKRGVSVRGHAGISWSVANWAESVRLTRQGEPMSLWRTQPARMLAKVAAAEALRRTFQQEFADLKLTFSAELGERMPHRAEVSDLYFDETDATGHRLVSGFDPTPEPEEGQFREPAPAPTVTKAAPAKAASTEKPAMRQGSDPDGSGEFWTYARLERKLAPNDAAKLIGAPSMMAWLQAEKGRTWADALAALKATEPQAEPSGEVLMTGDQYETLCDLWAGAGNPEDTLNIASRERYGVDSGGLNGEQCDEWITELMRKSVPEDSYQEPAQPELMKTPSADPADQRKRR